MKSFKECDIREEEEIIEKSINDGILPAQKEANYNEANSELDCKSESVK